MNTDKQETMNTDKQLAPRGIHTDFLEAYNGSFLDVIGAGNLDAVKTFVENGVPVNTKGYLTIFILFSFNFDKEKILEIVSLFLEHGADPNLKSECGLPILAAFNEDLVDVVSLLLEKGAKVPFKGEKTLLDLAAEHAKNEFRFPVSEKMVSILKEAYKKDAMKKLTTLAMSMAPLNLPVLQVLTIASNLIDLSLVPETVQWEIVKCVKHFKK